MFTSASRAPKTFVCAYLGGTNSAFLGTEYASRVQRGIGGSCHLEVAVGPDEFARVFEGHVVVKSPWMSTGGDSMRA